MKTNIFLIGISLILLTACSAEKIVIDEMTITDPEQYKQLKNEQLSVSTSDTVKSEILNVSTKKVITRKGLLYDRLINHYAFGKDTFFINDSTFHSVVALKSISKIKFKGLWDNKLGFISENDINDYYSETQNKTLASVAGIFGGMLGGFISAIVAACIYGGLDPSREVGTGLGMFLSFGLLGGTVAGFNVAYDLVLTKDKDTIIKEMKESKKTGVQ